MDETIAFLLLLPVLLTCLVFIDWVSKTASADGTLQQAAYQAAAHAADTAGPEPSSADIDRARAQAATLAVGATAGTCAAAPAVSVEFTTDRGAEWSSEGDTLRQVSVTVSCSPQVSALFKARREKTARAYVYQPGTAAGGDTPIPAADDVLPAAPATTP